MTDKPWEQTYRPRALQDGGERLELVPWCKCSQRRGPRGGVCGNCGEAIPSDRELDAGAPEYRTGESVGEPCPGQPGDSPPPA
jgi:hypothetical protein